MDMAQRESGQGCYTPTRRGYKWLTGIHDDLGSQEILRSSLDKVAVNAEDGCKQGSSEVQASRVGGWSALSPHVGLQKGGQRARIAAGMPLTMHKMLCFV